MKFNVVKAELRANKSTEIKGLNPLQGWKQITGRPNMNYDTLC